MLAKLQKISYTPLSFSRKWWYFFDLSSITLYFWGFYFIGKVRFLLFLITVHEYNCCLSSSYDTPSFLHQFSIETMDHRWTIDGVSTDLQRFFSEVILGVLFFFISFLNLLFLIFFHSFCKISFLFLHNSKKKATFVVDLRGN